MKKLNSSLYLYGRIIHQNQFLICCIFIFISCVREDGVGVWGGRLLQNWCSEGGHLIKGGHLIEEIQYIAFSSFDWQNVSFTVILVRRRPPEKNLVLFTHHNLRSLNWSIHYRCNWFSVKTGSSFIAKVPPGHKTKTERTEKVLDVFWTP